MFTLQGIIKGEKIKTYKKDDGSEGVDRQVYIEPEGSMFPVLVKLRDHELEIGEKGDEVTLKCFAQAIKYVEVPGQKKKRREKAVLEIVVPHKNDEL